MKRSELRRGRRRKATDRERSEAWARHAQSKPCALCGSRLVQGHHVITQQELRRIARSKGLDVDRLLWDRRNCLALCQRHHDAHHSWSHRLTLDLVLAKCPKVAQFARELDLEWWLERNYPNNGEAAA
jgi:hypothetical protein